MKAHLEFSQQSAAAWRLRAQGLVTPFASLETTAAQLIGVQAQMLPAAALALAVRTVDGTTDDVIDALYRQRSLVRLWGQRHTLHLFASSDWPLIYAANADQPTYFEREARMRGEAETVYHAKLDRVADLLLQRGSLGRSDLRAPELGLSAQHLNGWGGIFSDLARRGLACHGEPTREARMVHRLAWLPQLDWQPPSPLEANLELIRRYLHAFGPAEAADIALWRGRPLRDVRGWLAQLAPELVPVTIAGRPGWLLQADAQQPAAPAVTDLPDRLLGRFELLLLAYADKTAFLDHADQAQVRRPAGHLEATMWRHGRVVGTWRSDPVNDGVRLSLRPFRQLDRAERRSFEQCAAQIALRQRQASVDIVWQDTTDG